MKLLLMLVCVSCFAVPVANCPWMANAQADSIMACLAVNKQVDLAAATYTLEKPIVMQNGWKLTGVSPSATVLVTTPNFYNTYKSMLIFDGVSGAVVRNITLSTTNLQNSDGVIQLQSGVNAYPANNNTVDAVWITSTGTMGGNAVVMTTKDGNAAHSMFFNKFRNMTINGFRRGFLLCAAVTVSFPSPGGTPTPNPVSGNFFDNNTTYAVEHFVFGGGSQQNNVYKHTCAGGVSGNTEQQICIKLGNTSDSNSYTADNLVLASANASAVPVSSSSIAYNNNVVMTSNLLAASMATRNNNVELTSTGFINKWVGPKSLLSTSHKAGGGYLIGAISSNGTDYVCLVSGKAIAQETNLSFDNATSRIIQIDACVIGQTYPNNSSAIHSENVPF